MASTEFDIAQLTADQQLALQQYTSVTDQALDAAVPLLRKCEWNVQVCSFTRASVLRRLQQLTLRSDCHCPILRWRTSTAGTR